MAGTWLKISMDFCDDEKIKYIRRQPGGDVFVWLWLWILTTAMKKETDTLYLVAGLPYDPETIAAEANVKIEDVKQGFVLFAKLNMIIETEDGGILVINFHKHQSIAQLQHKRDLSKIRKQNQREREKQAQIEYVTRDICDNHATEEKREDKKRKDKSTTKQPVFAEETKLSSYPDDFEALWKCHKRKLDNKAEGYKSYLKLRLRATVKDLTNAVKAYTFEMEKEKREHPKRKMLSTFFNSNDWEGYINKPTEEPEIVPQPF